MRTPKRGIEHHRGKYTDATVQEVRKQYDEGLALKVIARNTGVPLNTMTDWIYKKERRVGCKANNQ